VLALDFEIKRIAAREIIDSRGNPTVEVEVFTGCSKGLASVPSGASTGSHEALELRDGDSGRYHGKGVLNAVSNVCDIIAPRLMGFDVREQEIIDEDLISLDDTPNKSRLGANAILGVSLAVSKAAAEGIGIPFFNYLAGGKSGGVLPVPMMNVVNGGKHAGNEISVQEFMILPVGADRFSDALRIGCEVYHSLKGVLTHLYGKSAVNVGDEGGFAPPSKTIVEVIEALCAAVRGAGYIVGDDVVFALDSAATEFYDLDRKVYHVDGKDLSCEGMIDYYCDLVERYPIKSLEDPLYEDDFQGLASLTERIGRNVQVVGDDIFVTNVERLKRGIAVGAGNALLLKVNQVGTLTEAMNAASLCFSNRYGVVVSHRSGETEDTSIADLSVALGGGQIKTGAPSRGERTCKYNRLLRIEEALGGSAKYLGLKALSTTF